MKVYEKIYKYYVDKMMDGTLSTDDKMPSLRESERILNVSRTSVENAYMQLAADGYIYSVEKVGFFVSDMAQRMSKSKSQKEDQVSISKKNQVKIKYDLATIGEDKRCSCLELWRRYMKSALRQEDRLLSYGANQGEEDLREEIASYVRRNRNIICSPDDIVVGAGFQALLIILMGLIEGEKSISFPTKEFADVAEIFKAADYKVSYRDKDSHVIYVTPSYMKKWGEIMTMKRRQELIDHAKRDNHLIIEDDYQNEFVFSSKATPSLYAMTGGENVAFLGSFSRVLLPSVRISYLILPRGYRDRYLGVKALYNQTASKAEQIALAQFLRDGHMGRHIRKTVRLYDDKRQKFYQLLKKHLSSQAQILMGQSGMELCLVIPKGNIGLAIRKSGVAVNIIEEKEGETILLLSCSIIEDEDMEKAIKTLKAAL